VPEFVTEVENAFARLRSSASFEVISHETSQSFDNAHVELHGGTLRVRFIRERGQVFADIGPASHLGQWHQLDHLLRFLNRTEAAEAWLATGQTSVAGLAGLVEEHLAEILPAFEPAAYLRTKQQLAKLAHALAEERFGSS
jgi:hypothetical protein